MNQNYKPFDNPKIRQAVAYAINRQALVDTFFGGPGVAADNWMPPGTLYDKPTSRSRRTTPRRPRPSSPSPA